MTAEEILKKYNSKSWIEKFKENGVWGKSYYCVFRKNAAGAKQRIGEGNTKPQAWGDAACWVLAEIVQTKFPVAEMLITGNEKIFAVNINGQIFQSTSKAYTAWLKAVEALNLCQ